MSMYMHAYVQYLFSCMHIVCLSIHSNEIVHLKPSFRYFIDQKLVLSLFFVVAIFGDIFICAIERSFSPGCFRYSQ